MYKALCPYAIGVHPARLEEALTAARAGDFQGVEFSPHEVADRVEAQGAAGVRTLFADAGVRPAAWGLPVDWRGSEADWRQGLAELPRLARAASLIGGTRVTTWVMPGSDERPFEENYGFHVDRFRPISAILGDHGCFLGLEFIGPKTLRDSLRYPFLYQMEGMLGMAQEIGANVGLLLDCWHWYTSGGSREGIGRLKPAQVVYVHVNDAPAGIPVDEQVDDVRALPGETGVIDVTGFLRMLASIGYEGPVTPDPFKRELSSLPSDSARLAAVGGAMNKIFSQAGLRP